MKYRYSTKEGQFETNIWDEIPWDDLHSINDKPAYEDLGIGYKDWRFEGKWHRENGPAIIYSNGNYYFWLNDKMYENENDWLIDNPNKDILFQVQMILKYS